MKIPNDLNPGLFPDKIFFAFQQKRKEELSRATDLLSKAQERTTRYLQNVLSSRTKIILGSIWRICRIGIDQCDQVAWPKNLPYLNHSGKKWCCFKKLPMGDFFPKIIAKENKVTLIVKIAQSGHTGPSICQVGLFDPSSKLSKRLNRRKIGLQSYGIIIKKCLSFFLSTV